MGTVQTESLVEIVVTGSGLKHRENDVIEGKFQIRKEIGGGGFGTVYLAYNREDKKLVAIKEFSTLDTDPSQPSREDLLVTFEREGKLLARLTHPNIPSARYLSLRRPFRVCSKCHFEVPRGSPSCCPHSQVLEIPSRNYIVMDYIEGEVLESLAESRGKLAESFVLPLIIDVADALNGLHMAGIVHGDVKPQNILCQTSTGRAYLLDFGNAVEIRPKATIALVTLKMRVFTPGYAAPEQRDEGRASPQSDIFSLGMTLYRLVSGLDPMEEASLAELEKHRPCQISPGLSTNVETLILRSIRRHSPPLRTMDEMLEALRSASATWTRSRPKTRDSEAAGKLASVSKALGLALVSLAFGGALLFRLFFPSPPGPDRIQRASSSPSAWSSPLSTPAPEPSPPDRPSPSPSPGPSLSSSPSPRLVYSPSPSLFPSSEPAHFQTLVDTSPHPPAASPSPRARLSPTPVLEPASPPVVRPSQGDYSGQWQYSGPGGITGTIELKPARNPDTDDWNFKEFGSGGSVAVYLREVRDGISVPRELHVGNVVWINDNTFTITADDDKVYTYRRSAVTPPISVPSSVSPLRELALTGIWNLVDPETNRPVCQLEFKRDHRYLMSFESGESEDGEWIIENGVLSLRPPDYQYLHNDLATGRITRKTEDLIDFKAMRIHMGGPLAVIKGKHYQLQRQ